MSLSYYEKNKDRIKQYYLNNRETIIKRISEYNLKNKEKISRYQYFYFQENKQRIYEKGYIISKVVDYEEEDLTQQTAQLQQEVERLKGLFKSMEDEIAFSDRNSIKESQSTIRGILRLIELAIYNSQQYENGR